MDTNRTIWGWAADWLAVRRPTRLIVDGLVVMLCGGVVYFVWALWWQMNEDALRTAASRGNQVFSMLLSTVHHGLFDLGVVIVAAGCARIISEGAGWAGGRRTPMGPGLGEAQTTHTPTGVMP